MMLTLPMTADVCPFCGRPLRMALAELTGRPIPLSVEPAPEGVLVVTADPDTGALRVRTVPAGVEVDGERVESHLSECDRPSKWRVGKGK